MRRSLALLPIIALGVVGCTDISSPVPLGPEVKDIQDPTMKVPSELYLSPPGTDTNKLTVGAPPSEVTRIFPEPKSSFAFRGLPHGFTSRYSALGYNSPEGSFGAIYFSVPEEGEGGSHDAVALAMTSEDGLTNDVVLSTEKQYADAYADDFGTPTILTGKLVRYWFWSDNKNLQTFMLCAVVSKDSKQADHYQLTAALGDNVVMKYLRMDIADAKADGAKLEKVALKETPATAAPPEAKSTHFAGTSGSTLHISSKQDLGSATTGAPPDTAGTTSGQGAANAGGTGDTGGAGTSQTQLPSTGDTPNPDPSKPQTGAPSPATNTGAPNLDPSKPQSPIIPPVTH